MEEWYEIQWYDKDMSAWRDSGKKLSEDGARKWAAEWTPKYQIRMLRCTLTKEVVQ